MLIGAALACGACSSSDGGAQGAAGSESGTTSDASTTEGAGNPEGGGFDTIGSSDSSDSPDADGGGPACQIDDDCADWAAGLGTCRLAECGPTGACESVQRPDYAPCEDEDACTAGDFCQEGICRAGGIETACDDGNACTVDVCSPLTGACSNEPLTGSPCDDGSPCSVDDRCTETGHCLGNESGACPPCSTDEDCLPFNDGNVCNGTLHCDGGLCVVNVETVVQCPAAVGQPCRLGTCDPSTGQCLIADVPDGSGCDDGEACTVNDSCSAGQCIPGGSVCPCDGADVGCQAFEDGDLCNGVLACLDGLCTPDPSSVPTCPAESPGVCRRWECQSTTGECTSTPEPEGWPCEDGDLCTAAERCAGTECSSGVAVICEDGNPCTDDACAAGIGCESTTNRLSCDDGDACTIADLCEGGLCAGTMRACDDGEPCTLDSCVSNAGGCVHTTLAESCDDGDPCTLGDACGPSGCVGTSCDDGLACTEDVCVPGEGCVFQPNDDLCEEPPGPCSERICSPLTGCNTVSLGPKACDDGDPCTIDACDPDAGCLYAPKVGPCSDGNPCTQFDECQAGSCVPGAWVCGTCLDDSDCAAASLPGVCIGAFTCEVGQCTPAPDSVADCVAQAPACTIGACGPTGACVFSAAPNNAPCDDSNACTEFDACKLGECVGQPLVCNDSNPCTADSCDPAFGCRHTPVTAQCDDGDPCTVSDHCGAGVCTGGAQICCDDAEQCGASEPCTPGLCLGGRCAWVGFDECTPAPSCEERAVCDDANACTYDRCADAECSAYEFPGCSLEGCLADADCFDNDPCTHQGCLAGACLTLALPECQLDE